MKLYLLMAALLCVGFSPQAQNKEEAAVRQLLADQAAAWNRGDIKGFMNGYWESDSLMFIGKSGITYGWQQTLENYKRGYPDTAAMGKLHFELLQVKRLSVQYFYVVGKWQLTRSMGNVGGHFNLLLRKIKKKWVVIADHSS
jgi:ketosteroid isomerase-like protein